MRGTPGKRPSRTKPGFKSQLQLFSWDKLQFLLCGNWENPSNSDPDNTTATESSDYVKTAGTVIRRAHPSLMLEDNIMGSASEP